MKNPAYLAASFRRERVMRLAALYLRAHGPVLAEKGDSTTGRFTKPGLGWYAGHEVMDMEPARFGPFLKNARQEAGLTQAQLAERLHVTTAAVSKWERGKCLPDVTKLDDIAAALDMSVLEVLRCERQRQSEAPREALAVVYTETVRASRAQHRRAWTAACVCVTAVLLAALALHWFPVYRIARVWQPSYYDTGEVSLLAYIGSPEDRRAARTVLAKAELAFSELGLGREEAQEKYGALSRYVICADSYPAAVSERHTLKLWSARFYGSDGLMWVWYSQEGMDTDGNTVTGSWDIPALWSLEKTPDGTWEVTHIKEHP